MSFNVYFDESNKIDNNNSNNNIYSYYGATGCDVATAEYINKINIDNNIELHFVKFSLKDIFAYLKILGEMLKKEFYFNVFVVNTEEAYRVIKHIEIDEKQLRPLLYIKIPERLIYGITRHISPKNKVEIYIDKNSEYDENELTDKLEEQLNAQAIYRKLNYSVLKVEQIDSKEERMVQISDTLLGIIAFLFEEKYLNPNEFLPAEKYNKIIGMLKGDELEIFKKCYGAEKNNQRRCLIKLTDKEKYTKLLNIFKKVDFLFESGKSVAKSELIYQLFSTKENLLSLYDKTMYVWDKEPESTNVLTQNESKEYVQECFSKYMASFFQYKSIFDGKYKNKALNIYKEHNYEIISEKVYIKEMGFTNDLKILVRRYLSELQIRTTENRH